MAILLSFSDELSSRKIGMQHQPRNAASQPTLLNFSPTCQFFCGASQPGNSKTDLENAGLHDLCLPDNAVKLIADVASTCQGVTGVDRLRRIAERSADPRGVARRDQTPQSVTGRLCSSHRLNAPNHCSPRQSLYHLRGCLCTNCA